MSFAESQKKKGQDPLYQAFFLLKVGFAISCIILGFDKFFHLLSDWQNFIAPVFVNMIGLIPSSFLSIVGIIQVIIGFGVFLKPRTFSYLLVAMFVLAVINSLLLKEHLVEVVENFALVFAALGFNKLSEKCI